MRIKRFALTALALGMMVGAGVASAQELKIGLIMGKTGLLEAYAKETEVGFDMGLEYMTKGTMMVNGQKLKIIKKDDQSKPDLAKALLAEAFNDDKVALAVGTTSSGAALAMLPVALENKKILVVEPAVADSITGDKWNKYIFRTGRSSSQDAYAGAATFAGFKGETNIAFLAQDYSFGKDGIRTFKEALASMKMQAKVIHEEYVPLATTDFTAPAQRIFDVLKDKPGNRLFAVIWAGPIGAHPMNKIMDLKPQRYNIAMSPGGNLLPQLKLWKQFGGTEGSIYYYYGFPKNDFNKWFVAEHQKRYNKPPDFFTAGGAAAAGAVVTALQKAKSADTEKLMAAMEGMEFPTPKGSMTFRKEDHQAMQPMYHFRIKQEKDQKGEWDLLELVREIKASDMPIPITNKR